MDRATFNQEQVAELAARIRRGEADAEADLVRYFGERILMIARIRCKDPDASLDVTQEVLMAVICALRNGQLRAEESLAAFVYGTTRNLIANHQRTLVRQRETALPADVPEPEPADSVLEAERVEMAKRALGLLEAKDREVLMLTLADGLKPAEIARRTGASVEAVRMRKSRALKKVAETVKKMLRKNSLRPPGSIRL